MTGPRAFDPKGDALVVTRRDKSPGDDGLKACLFFCNVERYSRKALPILKQIF